LWVRPVIQQGAISHDMANPVTLTSLKFICVASAFAKASADQPLAGSGRVPINRNFVADLTTKS